MKLSEKQFQKIADALLFTTICGFILTAKFSSILLAILTGICSAFVAVVSHNYLHRRDNWRMYYINLTGLNYREWRVAHVVSHHMYPNSVYDLEVSNMEPMLQWIPMEKSKVRKASSVVLCPVVWLLLIHSSIFKR
jgi:uncharacterized membrane protein